MSIIQRVKSFFGTEGSDRGMPFALGEFGGGPFQFYAEQGFQRNLSLSNHNGIAAVQAAKSKLSDAMAAMPLQHFKESSTVGYSRVKSSAFTRWLRHPTGWQTLSEWLVEGERQLLDTGNAVALLTRNDRNEVVEITWAQYWGVHVDAESGAVFYTLSMPQPYGAWDDATLVPARDVMHLRINVDGRRDPLRGRSPLEWCAAALATNSTLSGFLVSYLNNRASPSYALTTDLALRPEQMAQLRAAWAEQSKSINSGGTPILSQGLKPVPLGVAPGDALLVDTFNMTVEDIARAFSLPKTLLGIDETASNAHSQMQQWVTHGLGAHVEMWEQALEKAFDFKSSDHVEFDTTALLRLDPQAEATRIKELVTGGVLSIDEARDVLRLPPVEGGFGSIPTQQQQQIPLDLLAELHASNIASKATPQPAPESIENDPPPADSPEKNIDSEITKALVVSMFDRKRKSA